MEKLSVLIVAYHADAGELYSEVLAGTTSAEIIWVRDGAAAERLIRASVKIDVVVMDVSRPSEWEACEALGRLAATPVLVITGWLAPDGRFRQRALDAGCAAFVAKPCDPSTLVETVRRVRSGERGIVVESRAPVIAAGDPPVSTSIPRAVPRSSAKYTF